MPDQQPTDTPEVDLSIVATPPEQIPAPPERVFQGYDLYQLQMHHTPVWKRGDKYFVKDWFDGKEYEHSTEGYTPDQLRTLDRVAIKEDDAATAKPQTQAIPTIGSRRR